MDKKTQAKLISLTSEFYSKVADSFSETRQNAWDGWERVMSSVELPPNFELLDVACGNLRFEKFLEQRGTVPRQKGTVPTARLELSQAPALRPEGTVLEKAGTVLKSAICVDNCELLLPEGIPDFVRFENKDLFSETLDYSVDLVVCFGFMHHIPSFERRKAFLEMLMNNVKSGGYVALSFWQFMKDERIAKKAEGLTKKCDLQLEEGDFLLGWKNRADVFRYCHNFSDEEIGSLCEGLEVVAEFSEDGKSHNLNKYVILKK